MQGFMDSETQQDSSAASFFPQVSETKPQQAWASAAPGQIVRPDLAGPMLNFKAFLELQGGGGDLAEVKKVYQQYRQDYELRFAEIFFTDHKTEPWFQEKYHPLLVQEAKTGRLLAAQLRHKQFIADFQAKGFAGLLLRDQTEIVTAAPLFAFDPNVLTLFLGLIPINVWKKEVLNAVHAAPGFLALSLSEPIASQGFCRFAWARFDTQSHCDESCRLLTNVQVTSQYAISATPSQKAIRKVLKVQPPQTLPSLIADWKNTASLIAHLDKQYEITENQLIMTEERFTSLEETGKEEQLDLQLLYLRRVYGLCYFCGDFCEDERELAAKCGPVHLRSKVNGTQEGQASLSESKLTELMKRCVVPSYDPEKDEALQAQLTVLISELVLTEPGNKVRCSRCKKLFFDEKYLRKHIKAKHGDQLETLTAKHQDKLMFERFMLESCRFAFNSSGDNMRAPARRAREEAYQDLDDPTRKRPRRMVDYSDI
jgi:uncharacterized C2H2 Zn-finger protein